MRILGKKRSDFIWSGPNWKKRLIARSSVLGIGISVYTNLLTLKVFKKVKYYTETAKELSEHWTVGKAREVIEYIKESFLSGVWVKRNLNEILEKQDEIVSVVDGMASDLKAVAIMMTIGDILLFIFIIVGLLKLQSDYESNGTSNKSFYLLASLVWIISFLTLNSIYPVI